MSIKLHPLKSFFLLAMALLVLPVVGLGEEKLFRFNADPGKLQIDRVSVLADPQADFEPELLEQRDDPGYAWETEEGALLNLGISEHPLWLRFTVVNPKISSEEAVFEIHAPPLNHVTVYHKQIADWGVIDFGDQEQRDSRLLDVETYAFELILQPGKNEFLVRIHSSGFIQLPITIYEPSVFLEQTDDVARLRGVFSGIALAMLFFNLFLYFQTRETAYFALSVLIAVGVCQQFYFNGVAHSHFPDSLWWNDRAPYTLSLCYMAAGLWFHNSYLKLRIVAPVLYRITFWWMCFYLVMSVLWLADFSVGLVFYSFTFVPPYITISAILIARKGYRSAKIYVIATLLPLLIVFFGFLLFLVGITVDTNYLILENMAGALSLFLFSIGLADRINELNQQKLEAEHEASRAQAKTVVKSEFLAKMSHEIRTPLNGLIGMSELLNQTKLDPDQRNYSRIIHFSSNTLLTIVNDLLDFSKAESGQLRLEKIPVDIHQLTTEAGSVFYSLIQGKGLAIHYHIDPDVPQFVIGDPTRIRQVIQN